MNAEQFMVLFRDALKVGGGIALALGATDATVGQWTSMLTMVAGALSSVVGVFWSQKKSTSAAIVQKAAALPGVTGIAVTDAKLATAAKNADPSVKVELKRQF